MLLRQLKLVTFSQVEGNQEFYQYKWGQTVIPHTMNDLHLMVKRHGQIEVKPVDGAYFVKPDLPECRGVFYSEAAKNIILEPKLGGRFYEDWGDDEGVLYATVTGIKRAERLELTGPMGMGGAVQGFISIQLEPKEALTVVRLSHRTTGEVTAETKANYGQGWQDLLEVRLKAFVETGQRQGLKRG